MKNINFLIKFPHLKHNIALEDWKELNWFISFIGSGLRINNDIPSVRETVNTKDKKIIKYKKAITGGENYLDR